MMTAAKEIVEVHNLDDVEYAEDHREEHIVIPAKGHIKMKRRKAVRFLAAYPPNKKDGTMRPKMLQIKRTCAAVQEETVYECHLDGKTFDTKEQLDAHLKQFKDKTVAPKNVTCPICDKECSDNDVFMEHLKIHKEMQKEKKEKPFKLNRTDLPKRKS